MRLDQERSEHPDHRAYGRGQNVHSLCPGPLRLPPRIQRAVPQSAAPAIRANHRSRQRIIPEDAEQAVEDTRTGLGRLGNGAAGALGKPRHPGDRRRPRPAILHDHCCQGQFEITDRNSSKEAPPQAVPIGSQLATGFSAEK